MTVTTAAPAPGTGTGAAARLPHEDPADAGQSASSASMAASYVATLV